MVGFGLTTCNIRGERLSPETTHSLPSLISLVIVVLRENYNRSNFDVRMNHTRFTVHKQV